MRVHQLTGVAGPFDAVTRQALAYRELLERSGMPGGAHAVHVAPGAPEGVEGLERLRAAPGDLLVLHYSGYVPGMQALLALPQRKLLVYHNITPARYFWSSEPRVAVTCEQGREQLPAFVRAAHLTAAVSDYNADELRQVGAREPRVVPILLDPARMRTPAAAGGAPAAGPLVLSVGRLAPHKRPDLVIRAFALYQRAHRPDARLLLVGPPLGPGTVASLEQLARDLDVRGVRVAGGLPQEELGAAFAEAEAFLSMSEHEGFCVPLLEALSAGLPSVARPVGGMPEVGGDAVLWAPDDDLAVVAELLHLALGDEELRAELRRRAGERVERFSYERVAGEVRAAVEAALA
jgi:glycosyltransferase involved in cell wall biosynthesis